jgi:hypothetical protein
MEGASEEQIRVASLLKENHVVVNSVAGSGKTFTALHIAKLNSHKHHLLLTYNAKLKIDTRKRVKDLGITNVAVHTFHSYAFAKDDYELAEHLADGITFETKFDTLMVDEVQDMKPMFFRLLCYIVQHHTNAGMRIVLFGDQNQCIYTFMKADFRYLTLAPLLWHKRSDVAWAVSPLSVSYRVTQPMARFVNDCMFGYEKLVAPKPSGVLPEYLVVDPFSQHGTLYRKVCLLLQEYKPEDIYILGYSLKNKMMRDLENNIKKQFPAVNTYAQTNDEAVLNESVLKKKLAFCTFHSSKGTERKVVVVLGFDTTFFNFYARTDDRTRCPNLLYVAATRATERLILVQTSAPLPFLRRGNTLMQCCDVLIDAALPQCLRCGMPHMNPCITATGGAVQRSFEPTAVNVTDFLRHLDTETVDRCFKMLRLKKVQEGGQFNLMPPCVQYNAPPFENSTMEEVSDITGTAIPAFYEARKKGSCTLVDCIESCIVRKADVLKDILNGCYRLPKSITRRPVSSEDYLFWANCWLACNSGYVGRLTQIKHYHWFPQAAMEQCMERLDDTMLRIHMDPNEYERSIDIDAQPETAQYRLVGRVDMLDAETMMEFKAVQELRREHYLQTALYMYMMQVRGERRRNNYLYNVLTDECVLVECDCLSAVVAELFRSKFAAARTVSDAEFLMQ